MNIKLKDSVFDIRSSIFELPLFFVLLKVSFDIENLIFGNFPNAKEGS